jgi:hypothetical protein
MVSGTSPKAGEIVVGDEYAAMAGTETGNLPLGEHPVLFFPA